MCVNLYRMETITNLHVGDMGETFSVVDKAVQRDALTGFPTIYATSLKGALRAEAEKDDTVKEYVNDIFGYDVDDDKSSKGNYRFNDMHLLFYPVRSDKRPYYLATCPAMINDAIRMCRLAGCQCAANKLTKLLEKEKNKLYCSGLHNNELVEAEDVLVRVAAADETIEGILTAWLPEEPGIIIFDDKTMADTLEVLPIVARNQLKSGISKALWYEEFVPRKSMFVTMISSEKGISDEFDTFITRSRCVQIGANATVGYGVCKFDKM